MTNYSRITIDRTDGVGVLRLARPEADNLFDAAMVAELDSALGDFAEDESTSFVVLRGTGGTFCTGLDDIGADGKPLDTQAFTRWERVVTALERLPQVTVAVIEGACTGAGLDLALACDCRIAAIDSFVQLPQVKVGLLPSMVLFRLPKYVGLGAAKRLVLTGLRWTATEAQGAGLLDFVVPSGELDTALAGVLDLLSPPDRTTVPMARRLLHEAYASTAEDAIGNFLAAQDRCRWKRSTRQVAVPTE